jgi:hypothetical protein
MELGAHNQARTVGIASIRADEGFPCLSLLMDTRSRKIAGFHARDAFEAEGAVRALEMTPRELPEGSSPSAI